MQSNGQDVRLVIPAGLGDGFDIYNQRKRLASLSKYRPDY